MLPPGVGGTKNSQYGFDPKFNMAAMLIYGKNHPNDFFSRTTRATGLIFCRAKWGISLYKNHSSRKQTLSGWGKVGKMTLIFGYTAYFS